MSRKFSGAATPEELKELDVLLRKDPEAQYSFEILNRIWPAFAENKEGVQHGQDGLQDEVTVREDQDNRQQVRGSSGLKTRRFKLYSLAACAVGLLILSGGAFFFGWFDYSAETQNGINEIVTRDGSRTRIMLPDGTCVWLNGGSRLTYPNDFSETAVREVTLCGEAYFEVVHNENHPFVIHTNSIDIKDLGTAFNVRAYQDDHTVEATLIEGSIEVIFHNDPSRKILLKPHEKITLFKEFLSEGNIPDSAKTTVTRKEMEDKNTAFQVTSVKPDPEYNVFAETAWTRNRLIFKNEPFGALANEMEHRYGVKIHIADEKIRDYQLTGAFRDETIQQALEELRLIAPFHYRISGDSIIIYL